MADILASWSKASLGQSDARSPNFDMLKTSGHIGDIPKLLSVGETAIQDGHPSSPKLSVKADPQRVAQAKAGTKKKKNSCSIDPQG